MELVFVRNATSIIKARKPLAVIGNRGDPEIENDRDGFSAGAYPLRMD